MKKAFQRALLVVFAGGAIMAMGGAAVDLWSGERAITILAVLGAIGVVATHAFRRNHVSPRHSLAMLLGLAAAVIVVMANKLWMDVLGVCLWGAAWLVLRAEEKEGAKNHARS